MKRTQRLVYCTLCLKGPLINEGTKYSAATVFQQQWRRTRPASSTPALRPSESGLSMEERAARVLGCYNRLTLFLCVKWSPEGPKKAAPVFSSSSGTTWFLFSLLPPLAGKPAGPICVCLSGVNTPDSDTVAPLSYM